MYSMDEEIIAASGKAFLQKGKRRYVDLCLIGKGGMGEVYRARDTLHDTEVALKIVRKQHAANESLIKRFAREVKALARLSHPNVVQIYDYHEHHGRHYYTMEYIEGSSLRDLLASGKTTLATAVEYLTQLARGVAAAHEIGIIHRDLKPSNILVDRQGRVKLLDFGLVTFEENRDSLAPLTQTGQIVGTLKYITPETIRGERARTASDVYQLGIILYEILTGHHPFADASLADLLGGDILLRIDAPVDSCPSCDTTLSWLTMAMLSLRPSERPTAAEVSRNLERWSAGKPLSAEQTVAGYSSRRVRLATEEGSEQQARALERAGRAAVLQVGGSGRSLLLAAIVVITIFTLASVFRRPAALVVATPSTATAGARATVTTSSLPAGRVQSTPTRATPTPATPTPATPTPATAQPTSPAPARAPSQALHALVKSGSVQQVSLLLAQGASLNDRDEWRRTPLHCAVLFGKHELVSLFCRRGTQVATRDGTGRTVLHHVAGSRDARMTRQLLDSAAPVNARDIYGYTALHLCVMRNDTAVAACLLERGARLDLIDDHGRTVLHTAAAMQSSNFPALFRAAGGSFDAVDDRGFKPVDYAPASLAELYRPRHEGPNEKAKLAKLTPLHSATLLNDYAALRSMLDKESDLLDEGDGDGRTPLHLAAMSEERLPLLKLLLERGARVEARDHRDETPLHVATREASPLVVQTLLRGRANPNAANGSRRTPLMLAALAGGQQKCALLIDGGAAIDSQDWDGFDPLHLACSQGHRETVALLLRKGAKPNSRSQAQWTPLFQAVIADALPVVKVLLEGGAVLNARSSSGLTALYWARRLRRSRQLQNLLIDSGAND